MAEKAGVGKGRSTGGFSSKLLLLATGYSTTIYISTHFVLYETQIGINRIAYDPILIVTSLANVLLFVYLLKVLYDIAIRERRKSKLI
ncbi:MAG: hypothetical protein P4L69_15255 [Desulfosporosinus sp.]|nr:hypothetical protein [Desulfosporosinus sp.]